ncbi:hypothetical protein [uncultured Clostridium sp.]|uniref:hypothetical protein n=1 Tax=uncultured Clostridium sp. TaxID=59620 RepID=UPI0028E66891|nr:hypothetical protein [uncultured Clostridium sp.]
MWLYIIILAFILANLTIVILVLRPKSKACKIGFSITKWIKFEISTNEKSTTPSDQR